MMTQYETIRVVASNLANEDSERMVCPWCHGGRHKEESFIITRRGGDGLFVCHRASCGLKGIVSLSGSPTKREERKPPQREHKLLCDTFALSQQTLAALRDRFQFTAPMMEHYGLSETKEGDIIIPIYNSRGLIQGHERRVKEPGKAKAIRYNGLDADGMGWYNAVPAYGLPEEYVPKTYRDRRFIDHSIILVEDLFSAMKANAYMHSAALLGTHLSPEKAGELATMAYEHVFLALDQDATAKAAAIARRWRGILPNLRVVPLRADLKDTSYADVGTIIYNQLGNH